MFRIQTSRIALLLVATAASVAALLGSLAPRPAHAEEYAWCLVQDDINRCDFATAAQCAATGSGLSASCMENPRLRFQTPPVRPSRAPNNADTPCLR